MSDRDNAYPWAEVESLKWRVAVHDIPGIRIIICNVYMAVDLASMRLLKERGKDGSANHPTIVPAIDAPALDTRTRRELVPTEWPV